MDSEYVVNPRNIMSPRKNEELMDTTILKSKEINC